MTEFILLDPSRSALDWPVISRSQMDNVAGQQQSEPCLVSERERRNCWFGTGDDPLHVVRVPAGIRRRRVLFNAISKGLRFPGYFGQNWDALEECLRDLHWWPVSTRLVLVHCDLPFAASSPHRETYLSILRACAAEPTAAPTAQNSVSGEHNRSESTTESAGPELLIAFASECRAELADALPL